MVNINHTRYMLIQRALNLLAERLAKGLSSTYSGDDLSAIQKLQLNLDGEMIAEDGETLTMDEKDLVEVQKLLNELEQEINKINFKFMVSGGENANTIA